MSINIAFSQISNNPRPITVSFIEAVGERLPAGDKALALGWQKTNNGWQQRGTRVGWLEGEAIYLDLEASYKAAQRMSDETGGLKVTSKTLARRLSQAKLLLSQDEARGKHTVRKVITVLGTGAIDTGGRPVEDPFDAGDPEEVIVIDS